MIHIYDQDFEQKAHVAFHEAYMTHTSTSPNYQILASLDVGRRQLELEGYEMVSNTVALAMMIRRQIVDHPLLRKYFRVLKAKDLIPQRFRPSGLERFYHPQQGYRGMEEHWRKDEFALDPTRITLNVGATGIEGDAFRQMLSNRFDIQINKTSRNTILLMVNIGSSRGSATYLLDVLQQIAEELEEKRSEQSDLDRELDAAHVRSLIEQLPPLPNFSRFHPAFVRDPRGDTGEGDMRQAFFLAYDDDSCEHLHLDGSVRAAMKSGRTIVSAAFVTPYPPGFPILVPGQVMTEDIHKYLLAIDVKEIHGYEARFGLRIFREEALERLAKASSHSSHPVAEGLAKEQGNS
jgi:arginine decarboxylase